MNTTNDEYFNDPELKHEGIFTDLVKHVYPHTEEERIENLLRLLGHHMKRNKSCGQR